MKKIFKENKNKGILSIEFALILPILISVFLLALSFIYLVNIELKINRGINSALEDISKEIYLYSKLEEDIDVLNEINILNKTINEFLGEDINIAKKINQEILKNRIRKKTYYYMNINDSKPFWLKDELEFDISYASNSIIVRTDCKIHLPIIESFIGGLNYSQNNVQAARGVEKFFESIINSEEDDGEKVKITISKHSYSGNNKDPVYHDKNCWGIKASNPKTNIEFKIDKDNIVNGKLIYHGKSYRYCKYCKKMK